MPDQAMALRPPTARPSEEREPLATLGSGSQMMPVQRLERTGDLLNARPGIVAQRALAGRLLHLSSPRGPAPVQRVITFAKAAAGKTTEDLEGQVHDEAARRWIATWQGDKTKYTIRIDLAEAARRIEEMAPVLDRCEVVLGQFQRLRSEHDQRQATGQRNAEQTRLIALGTQQETHFDNQRRAGPNAPVAQLRSVLQQLTALLGTIEGAQHWSRPGPDPTDGQAPLREEPWDGEDVSHLSGMSNNLSHDPHVGNNKAIIDGAISRLRGDDDPLDALGRRVAVPRFTPPPGQAQGALKGAILYRYIRQSRRAIMDLVEQLGDSVALFSLERGGSFLADLIADAQERLGLTIPNIKISKDAGGIGRDYDRMRHHSALVVHMMDFEEGQMFRLLHGRGVVEQPPTINIALAETAVSGSSVSTLLGTLNSFHALLPQSRFTVLVEKQTLNEAKIPRATAGGMRGNDPGITMTKLGTNAVDKVRVFVSQVEYILGEDVGYQVSYAHEMRGQPLMVFDDRHGVVAAKLWRQGALPRDILRQLIGGAFDRALEQIFRAD